MPEQFPKLNLDTPRELDHVIGSIEKYADRAAILEWGKDVENKPALKSAWSKSLSLWTASARQKLEPNLLFNGMTITELKRQTKGLEPFDEDLSRHVQSLAERSDQLTEEVITYRKTLPARRAQAMQRRAQIVKQLEDKREAQRRKLEKQKADKVAASLPEMSVDLQRKDQVKRTLDQSVKDITGLQVSILEQATAAKEQTRLVKKLRSMP